jgi:D-tyrosyl-tRNA(Tyr) deacylase
MIALIQRVSAARVEVDNQIVGRIDHGICVFVGVQHDDCDANMERLVNRTLGYRVFADDSGRMNHSVTDVQAGVLIVSQFTLAADTDSGLRASYTPVAPAQLAKPLYDAFVFRARALHGPVTTGVFGADMQVTLCNDGPVSFILRG